MSQELTKEQMRVMIARAVGWQHVACTVCNEPGFVAKTPEGDTLWRGEGSRDADDAILRNCPDFCNDLNAMAQAAQYAGEHLFDADDWEQFGRELEAQHPTASLKDAQGKFYEDTYYQLASLVTGLSALNIATAFCRVLQTRKGE